MMHGETMASQIGYSRARFWVAITEVMGKYWLFCMN